MEIEAGWRVPSIATHFMSTEHQVALDPSTGSAESNPMKPRVPNPQFDFKSTNSHLITRSCTPLKPIPNSDLAAYCLTTMASLAGKFG